MFESIETYMIKNRDERRAHLKLEEACIDIGGDSKQFRGLFAHHIKTMIPQGKQALLCHACNNAKCSNVNHLYWGTDRDNHTDQMESETYVSFAERTRRKMGDEAYMMFMKNVNKHRRSFVKQKMSSDLEKYREIFSKIDTSKRGWVSKTALELKISHTHVRRIHKYLNQNHASVA